MYAIVADCYHWNDETEREFTKPMYLGIAYPPMNIYVFDEEHNSRSFRWANNFLAFSSAGSPCGTKVLSMSKITPL